MGTCVSNDKLQQGTLSMELSCAHVQQQYSDTTCGTGNLKVREVYVFGAIDLGTDVEFRDSNSSRYGDTSTVTSSSSPLTARSSSSSQEVVSPSGSSSWFNTSSTSSLNSSNALYTTPSSSGTSGGDGWRTCNFRVLDDGNGAPNYVTRHILADSSCAEMFRDAKETELRFTSDFMQRYPGMEFPRTFSPPISSNTTSPSSGSTTFASTTSDASSNSSNASSSSPSSQEEDLDIAGWYVNTVYACYPPPYKSKGGWNLGGILVIFAVILFIALVIAVTSSAVGFCCCCYRRQRARGERRRREAEAEELAAMPPPTRALAADEAHVYTDNGVVMGLVVADTEDMVMVLGQGGHESDGGGGISHHPEHVDTEVDDAPSPVREQEQL